MIVRSELKTSVREKFRGNFWNIVLFGFVLYIIPNIISNLADEVENDGLSMILSFVTLVIALLAVGMQQLVTQMMYRHPEAETFRDSIKLAFQYLRKYWKGMICTTLWEFLFIFLWLLPFFIILLIVGCMIDSETFDVTVAVILAIVMTLLVIIKQYQYAQAIYLYRDAIDQGKKFDSYRDFITESKQLMHGHVWEYFVLQISFIWWGLLEVVTLGIASMWVSPYIDTVNAAYYDALIAQHRDN